MRVLCPEMAGDIWTQVMVTGHVPVSDIVFNVNYLTSVNKIFTCSFVYSINSIRNLTCCL